MIHVLHRVVNSRPAGPDSFLSLEAEGVKPRPGTPPSVLERWDHVSFFADDREARALASRNPKKGRFIARLEIPDDDPNLAFHPLVGRGGHRDIKGPPEAFLPYIVDVFSVQQTEPRP